MAFQAPISSFFPCKNSIHGIILENIHMLASLTLLSSLLSLASSFIGSYLRGQDTASSFGSLFDFARTCHHKFPQTPGYITCLPPLYAFLSNPGSKPLFVPTLSVWSRWVESNNSSMELRRDSQKVLFKMLVHVDHRTSQAETQIKQSWNQPRIPG
jgi:hypothetical protein